MPRMTVNDTNFPDSPTISPSLSAAPFEPKTKRSRKKTYSRPNMHLLCKRGKQLLGPVPVPATIQEAPLSLYMHLWDGGTNRIRCQLCQIPIGEALNSPRRLLESKIDDALKSKKKVDMYKSEEQKFFEILLAKAIMYLDEGNLDKVRTALIEARKIQDHLKECADTIREFGPGLIGF